MSLLIPAETCPCGKTLYTGHSLMPIASQAHFVTYKPCLLISIMPDLTILSTDAKDSKPIHIGLSDSPYTNLETSDVDRLQNCTSVLGRVASNVDLECLCNSGASGRYLYVYAMCCRMDIWEALAYGGQDIETRA